MLHRLTTHLFGIAVQIILLIKYLIGRKVKSWKSLPVAINQVYAPVHGAVSFESM